MRKHKPGRAGFHSAVMKVDNFGVLQKESSGSATAGATGSGPTLGGSASTGTAGKGRAKAQAEVVRLVAEVGFRLFVCDLSQLLTHTVRARHMAGHVSASLPSAVKPS